jgi:hypothetical protein
MSIGNYVFSLVMREGSGTRVEDVEFHARKTKDIFKFLITNLTFTYSLFHHFTGHERGLNLQL